VIDFTVFAHTMPNRRKVRYHYIVGKFVGKHILRDKSRAGEVYLLDNHCLPKCYHEILGGQLVFVRAEEVARRSSSTDQSDGGGFHGSPLDLPRNADYYHLKGFNSILQVVSNVGYLGSKTQRYRHVRGQYGNHSGCC
jgi:hypothetical protein